MIRRNVLRLAVVAIAASFTGGASPARAADADFNGTWKWDVTRQNGDTMSMTLKLKQEGTKLTGTLEGPQGGPTEIKDGKVEADKVSFKIEREFNGNTFKTSYTGKLEGKSIKGKSESERNGETRSRDWEAKRD